MFFSYIRSFRILFFITLLLTTGCEKSIPAHTSKLINRFISPTTTTHEYTVSPVATDPDITSSTNNHFVSVQEGGSLKNTLFVFLPGTNRVPSESRAITRKAASLGFHVIGLMYSNQTAVNPVCSPTTDTTCHRRMRHEVLDGIDRHPSVHVDSTHSILNRLSKLLLYLEETNPNENWGQYLIDGQPNWEKIIISGHSQGGCIAGLIGKLYPIKKVIQISAIDFMNNGEIPGYQKWPVNKEKYFGLSSIYDELVPWEKVNAIWKVNGQGAYGPFIIVDRNLPPYQNSHGLITNLNPNTTLVDKYHNGTAIDTYIPKNPNGTYVYEKAWEYMLLK